MRNYFIIFPLLIILVSCTNSKNNVKVINESDTKIDSILLIGNQKCNPLIIKNLLPNNSCEGILENCNEAGGDGSYIVEIYTKNKKINKGFGYYTNGVMFFDEIIIKFTKKNTIIVEEKY
jgi:hypothetical protein